MSRFYRLINGQPVPCRLEDEWFGDVDERRVGYDEIGTVTISTVFLGLDHGFVHDGPPLLYETAVKHGTAHYDVVERYSTKEQAHLGHQEWVLKYQGKNG